MSGRLQPEPLARRDFLGLAAIWSSILAFLAAAVGALRLPMPSVFPESNSRVKLGHPEKFPPGSATHLADLKLWLHHDDGGLFAISSICTHLGCIAGREKEGAFKCPCHGSVFAPDGKVVAGPAPKRLNRLELSLAPDGQIVVDTRSSAAADARLKV